MIRKGEIDVEAVRKQLLERYDDAEIQAIINLYAQAYGDSGLTAEEVLEEILCDSIGKMNAFATESTRSLAGEVGVFLRNVRKSVRKQEGWQKNSATGDGGVVNSQEFRGFSTDKYFERQVDNWEEMNEGAKIKVGEVKKGSALYQVGFPAEGMWFDVGKIRKSMNDHDDHLTKTIIKNIPDLLSDPIAITEYRGPKGTMTNTASVYGMMMPNGKTPIVVGVMMTKAANGVAVINKVRTIHARGNAIINDENILYLNEDKKRTRNWFQVCGISVPLNGTKFGFIRSITYQDGKSQVESKVQDSSFITLGEKDDRAEHSREMDPVVALEKQVKLLRQQKEYWKSQTKRTDGKKADSKEVRKLGRDILFQYGSRTKLEDILPDLQWLTDEWHNYSRNSTMKGMSDRAEELARAILEGSGVDVNGDMAETRKELKAFLKGRPINVTEAIKAGIPDFGDFKKQKRALRFREDGSGTDGTARIFRAGFYVSFFILDLVKIVR